MRPSICWCVTEGTVDTSTYSKCPKPWKPLGGKLEKFNSLQKRFSCKTFSCFTCRQDLLRWYGWGYVDSAVTVHGTTGVISCTSERYVSWLDITCSNYLYCVSCQVPWGERHVHSSGSQRVGEKQDRHWPVWDLRETYCPKENAQVFPRAFYEWG